MPCMGRPIASWRWLRRYDVVIGLIAAGLLGSLWDIGTSSTDPATLYQVAGGEAAALIAFVITPVATLLTLSGGDRYRAFDRAQRPRIIRFMLWAFAINLVLLLLAVVGSAIDSPADGHVVLRLAVVGVSVASISAIARLVWIFATALRLHDSESDSIAIG